MTDQSYLPDPEHFCLFCLWSSSCCGCLPIIGLIIGLIVVIPITLVTTIINTILSIIYTPIHWILIYYTIIRTDHIGPNLKVLGCIFMWIPILLFPLIVLFSTIVTAVGGSIFYPTYVSFDRDGYKFWKIFYHTVHKTFKLEQHYWKFNHEIFYEWLREHRIERPGVEPFDIKLHKIPVCIVCAVCGVIFDGFMITCIIIINSVPVLFKTYYYVWKFYCESGDKTTKVFCLFPVLIAQVFMPFGWIFVMIILILVSWFVGLYLIYPAYKEGFVAAMKKNMDSR